jgi:hypothetical protein
MLGLIQKVFKFVSAAGMAQSVKGLFLDLPDTFTGDIKTFTNLFQRIFSLLTNTETKTNNFFLPLTQGAENFLYPA